MELNIKLNRSVLHVSTYNNNDLLSVIECHSTSLAGFIIKCYWLTRMHNIRHLILSSRINNMHSNIIFGGG